MIPTAARINTAARPRFPSTRTSVPMPVSADAKARVHVRSAADGERRAGALEEDTRMSAREVRFAIGVPERSHMRGRRRGRGGMLWLLQLRGGRASTTIAIAIRIRCARDSRARTRTRPDQTRARG